MFEIKDFHENVYIDGNVVVEEGIEVSLVDWCCHSSAPGSDSKDEKKILFAGKDVIIDQDNAIYHVSGEVSFYSENTKIKPNPYHCIHAYNNKLLELKKLFEMDFDFMEKRIINRMIYLNILSIYEFFIGDICATCFLRFDEIKESYLKIKRFVGIIPEEIESKMLEISHRHHLKMIPSVFSIKVPDISAISKAYKTRNDIAHRYNATKERDYLIVENKEIEDLIRETNKFVYKLFDRIIKKVYAD